jgi:hypothetical protein
LAVSVPFLFVSGGFVFAAEFYLFHFFFLGDLFHFIGGGGGGGYFVAVISRKLAALV